MRSSAFFAGIFIALSSSSAIAQSESEDRRMAQENFAEADKNGDNRLDRDEFRIFIDANADDEIGRSSMVRRWRLYRTAFRRVDANKDDVITWQELDAMGRR